jgi:hypothetical protein
MHHFEAVFGVQAHLGPFVFVERAWLGDNARVQSEFAYVVDHGGDPEAVDHLGSGVEVLGEGGGEGCDPEAMASEFLVPVPHPFEYSF